MNAVILLLISDFQNLSKTMKLLISFIDISPYFAIMLSCLQSLGMYANIIHFKIQCHLKVIIQV